jgi:proliferating cell nuclear antigen
MLLSKNYFKTFSECKNTHKITLDLKFVLKVISKFQKDSELCFKHVLGENNITLIQKNTMFHITMVDSDIAVTNVPDQEYVGDVNVRSSDLKDVVDTLELYTDTCVVTILKNKGQFILSGKGVFGEGHRSFNLSSDCGKQSFITKTYTDFFPISFLSKFMKSYKLSKSVNVCMVENHPIMIHFPVSKQSYIRYYVAPKVPDDTDSSQAMRFTDDIDD